MNKILLIISFIALTSLQAQAAGNSVPGNDNQGKVVKFYPNPANSYIIFDLQGHQQKGMTLSIYSFLGKKMYETQSLTEKNTVQLAEYNRGMYIFYLTDAAGKVIDTGKFQVSR
ncbi:MAG TPA: T9SS type A sorting domain-containing protein [Chitinophagaceae bacterium]|nr:T9SS type A sorting domain-containing protein [Chitinophagaceae bacterium]